MHSSIFFLKNHSAEKGDKSERKEKIKGLFARGVKKKRCYILKRKLRVKRATIPYLELIINMCQGVSDHFSHIYLLV